MMRSSWILFLILEVLPDELLVTHVFEQLLLVGDGRTFVLTMLVWFMVGFSVVFSCAQSWFVTAPRGCWLCSTSLPGGNQVDGLPPAPSATREKLGNERANIFVANRVFK